MRLFSWGKYPEIKNESYIFRDKQSLWSVLSVNEEIIPYGNGRSYGDSALNANILYCRPYDYFLDFDETRGVLHCQSGVLLSEILEIVVPKGWFLKVTPGTKYITLCGAIASDIHGKNHHKEGCFSSCVEEFTLMLPDGEVFKCSKEQNKELFFATCGGMGLTGVIICSNISLKKIK